MSDTEEGANCELLGGFGILVQSVLAVLCFMVLVFKRHIEKPKRLWKIFLMDTFKQLVSAIMQHFLNVGLALLLSKDDASGDQCEWYFITYMLDCTLGVFFNIVMIKLFEKLFERLGQRQFQTGNYYVITYPNITTYAVSSNDMTPVKAKPKLEVDYGAYAFQLILWSCIVVLSKIILYFFQLLLSNQLLFVADWFFAPISNNPELELSIVLVIIPLIFNALSFWIQDSFLKKTTFRKREKTIVLENLYEKSDEPIEVEVIDNQNQSSEVEMTEKS